MGLLILAELVSIFSIFAFFGNALSNTGGTIIPSMFDLMFGRTDGTIVWKQFPVLTFLFWLQITLIVLNVIGFFLCVKDTDNNSDTGGILAITALTIIGSLAALIISFFTVKIVNLEHSGVGLGAGPITYSILHIIVVLISIIGAINVSNDEKANLNVQEKRLLNNYTSDSNKPINAKKTITREEYEKQISLYKQMLHNKRITQEEYYNKINNLKAKEIIDNKQAEPAASKKTNDVQTIKLLKEYKKLLDSGVITQEEYEKKKKEIL